MYSLMILLPPRRHSIKRLAMKHQDEGRKPAVTTNQTRRASAD